MFKHVPFTVHSSEADVPEAKSGHPDKVFRAWVKVQGHKLCVMLMLPNTFNKPTLARMDSSKVRRRGQPRWIASYGTRQHCVQINVQVNGINDALSVDASSVVTCAGAFPCPATFAVIATQPAAYFVGCTITSTKSFVKTMPCSTKQTRFLMSTLP